MLFWDPTSDQQKRMGGLQNNSPALLDSFSFETFNIAESPLGRHHSPSHCYSLRIYRAFELLHAPFSPHAPTSSNDPQSR